MTRKRRWKDEYDALATVVRRYLAELDNPAPDFTMRRVYRDWMRELVDGRPVVPSSPVAHKEGEK